MRTVNIDRDRGWHARRTHDEERAVRAGRCAGQDFAGGIRWPICCESDKEADGTSELGLVPPIRIERTTNGLGM